MKLVLASASLRRKRLLSALVGRKKVKCMPAGIGERIFRREGFARACRRLALAKANAAAERKGAKGAVVVGADTIAYRGREIYRKTGSKNAARQILRRLSGKTHYVVTGVAVIFPGRKAVVYSEKAEVRMKRLDGGLLESYLESNEWKGRAGSYDVSGKGARLVARIKGEKETVVGLPLKKLGGLLAD